MKVVYLLQNPGIASQTPEGWNSKVFTAQPDGSYTDEALKEVGDADILVVGLEPVNKSFLAQARNLKLIQRLGVGYDNIDLEAAREFRIPVCNMPDFNADTVAEHTVMLILALLRRVFESTLLMKGGQWPPLTLANHGLFDLKGKVVGIVGCGLIGQAVAKRIKGFETEIFYYDKHRLAAAKELELGVAFHSLDDLLRQSDIITLHVPLTSETFHMISKVQFEKMKPSVFLINTARGAIIDQSSLIEALMQKRIAGAGLDVFYEEPLPLKHPLRSCPNLLLTPHLAGQTREAMGRMVALLLENMRRIATGKEPLHRVDK